MLNFCLRDSFTELFHCNRHFSIKGKSSVTFPIFPSQRVIKFLESLSIFTRTFCSRGISSNEFVTATTLSEELIDLYVLFLSANEAIFLFHVLFDATVRDTSLDFFFARRQFFFGCLSFLFFFLN